MFRLAFILILTSFRDRAELAAENLALRQQLAALQHKSKRPRLRKRDRIFWAILSRTWPNWRSAGRSAKTFCTFVREFSPLWPRRRAREWNPAWRIALLRSWPLDLIYMCEQLRA